ncbi:MAG: O-methyltransferase [Lentimicrobiaceae bacterium]|nr:O-methyltransferase [Lentimicrobiaceae bacterium]
MKPEIEEYAELHTSAETELLYRINRETHIHRLNPRMLSGHLQGKLLEFICCMLKPQNVLEVGTFTGYASICLAGALPANGRLHTIEINPEFEDDVLNYFTESGFEDKITLHLGDAMEIIPTMQMQFDLVFMDADKDNYLNYYNLLFDKINKGGFLIADNVLWGEKVLDTDASDKETKGIIAFNDFIQNDPRVENLLLPFRDGIMMVRKL